MKFSFVRIPVVPWFDSHLREIIRGSSLAFVSRIFGAGFGFILNLLIARLIGANGAGIYFLALSVVTLATVAGRLGLDNVVLRFVATNSDSKDWNSVAGVIKQSRKLALIASGIVAISVFLLSRPIALLVFKEPELNLSLKIMALAILPFSLAILQAQTLNGLKRVGTASLIQTAMVPVILVTSVGILSLFVPVTVIKIVTAYVFATVITWCIAFYLVWRALPHIRSLKGKFSARTLLSTSLPLFLVASMNIINNYTDITMLGIFQTSSDVGVYGIITRLSLLVSFVLAAFNSILSPKIAVFWKNGDLSNLTRTVIVATRLMTLVATVILVIYIIFPSSVLGLFGQEFVRGSRALAILSLGQFINVSTGSVGQVLVMTGHEKVLRNIIGVSAMTNVIMNSILIPVWSLEGAALATAFSTSFATIVAAIYVRRIVGIDAHIFGRYSKVTQQRRSL